MKYKVLKESALQGMTDEDYPYESGKVSFGRLRQLFANGDATRAIYEAWHYLQCKKSECQEPEAKRGMQEGIDLLRMLHQAAEDGAAAKWGL